MFAALLEVQGSISSPQRGWIKVTCKHQLWGGVSVPSVGLWGHLHTCRTRINKNKSLKRKRGL